MFNFAHYRNIHHAAYLKFLNLISIRNQISLIFLLFLISCIIIIIRANGPTFRANGPRANRYQGERELGRMDPEPVRLVSWQQVWTNKVETREDEVWVSLMPYICFSIFVSEIIYFTLRSYMLRRHAFEYTPF